MLGVSLIPGLLGSNTPISFVLAVLACVLGLLAAQGHKAWLTVPAVTVVVYGFLFMVALTASQFFSASQS
jgi:hypothetical protein